MTYVHLFDQSGTLVSCLEIPSYARIDMVMRIRRCARALAHKRGWRMSVIKPRVALAV